MLLDEEDDDLPDDSSVVAQLGHSIVAKQESKSCATEGEERLLKQETYQI